MAYSPKNANGQATMANSEPVVIASDQSAVPVSGTVTAELSATDNAVLDQIELNQDAQTALLTTIDADTSALVTSNAAIQTAVETIDNAIAGTEMQVDVVAPLPAGTNVIGALTANQSVNVAQINGVAVTMGNGTSGTGVQRVTIASDSTGALIAKGQTAADAAISNPPVTVGGRASTATPTAMSADGDVVNAWMTRNGAQVMVGDKVDDAAVTLGTDRPQLVGAVAVTMDGTDPTAVSAEGDAGFLRSDPNRILLVNQTHPRFFNVSADYASAQTNTTVQAAPGAGLSLYITDLVISNGATAGNITLLDGSGGTVKFELYPAINGGVSMSFRNPIKLTANTALVITSTTVTTHSLFVSGYIAA